jgi:hypothetical protein
VPVKTIEPGQEVAVCIHNRGPIATYIYGDQYTGNIRLGLNTRPTITTSSATLDGVPLPGDIALAVTTAEPRSLIARVPAIVRHADAFRPGFVSPGLYWVLLIGLLVGVPVLLARALARAYRDDPAATLDTP